MRASRRALWLVVLVGVFGATTAAALAATVSWGSAIKVPGTGALNLWGDAEVHSVSCPTAGNCTAAGSYHDTIGTYQAFVVDEHNGVWGNAKEAPGTAPLNHSVADVSSVSCASAGNCAVGGYYHDGSNGIQAFVADEHNGVWGTAKEVPGTAALNVGGFSGPEAKLTSVSCATAGNCAAGGYYSDNTGHFQAFVVAEANGVWSSAKRVPGTGALNVSGYAQVTSISCRSAGNCTAGGFYFDNAVRIQPFVVVAKTGVWGNAVKVTGPAALNLGDARVWSVSCATAGNCAAGGYYLLASGFYQPFVVDMKSGVWRKAINVPGMANLHSADSASVNSVSCASAGNCTAGGYYNQDGYGHEKAFVVAETNGVWGNAKLVPGLARLNVGGWASVNSVSCASAGNCAAGGVYSPASSKYQAFAVRETNGVWGTAIKVPGTAALNLGGAANVTSVSCTKLGKCAIGGYYLDGLGHTQAFLTAP